MDEKKQIVHIIIMIAEVALITNSVYNLVQLIALCMFLFINRFGK